MCKPSKKTYPRAYQGNDLSFAKLRFNPIKLPTISTSVHIETRLFLF